MAGFYENFRRACASRGTTITQVLKKIGRPTGSTGAWKAGKSPKLDTTMEIAAHLHMSLDELCYGPEGMTAKLLTDDEREWLALIAKIPQERRQMCRDFLHTHAAAPEQSRPA